LLFRTNLTFYIFICKLMGMVSFRHYDLAFQRNQYFFKYLQHDIDV
jgi:hypothetical protein